MCTVLNMKLVCLMLWLGEVCIDDAKENANTDTNDDAQSMIV